MAKALAPSGRDCYSAHLLADVAQLVEHLTCNQGVASSIPAVGTKTVKKASKQLLAFLLWLFPTGKTLPPKPAPSEAGSACGMPSSKLLS